MAKEIKHVGKLKNTGDKVAVVFRTVILEYMRKLLCKKTIFFFKFFGRMVLLAILILIY